MWLLSWNWMSSGIQYWQRKLHRVSRGSLYAFPLPIVSRFGRSALSRRLRRGFFQQAEPAGRVARGGGLQKEGGAHRERHQRDRDLGAFDAAGQEYARHGSWDDPRVAAPAQEDDLVARPATPPVREQAGEDGNRAGHEDEDCHHQEAADEVL